MRRRDFLSGLGGAAASWPLGARAQQAALPVVGFMSSRSAPDSVHLVAAFREGLSEAGFVDGQNVIIEFRWADGQYDQLPALAAQLVSRPVTVLVGVGGDSFSYRGEAGDFDDSNRLWNRQRSGQGGLGR